MARPARFPTVLALALVAAGTLAACASPAADGGSPTTSSPTPGSPTAEPAGTDVSAAWLDGGRMIGLVTQGSSTCVPQAEGATLTGETIEVTLATPDPDTDCTDDLVPRVTLVGTPEGVDPAQDATIHLTGGDLTGNTDLAGAVGLSLEGMTDYEPSAGWTGEPEEFVLLSWGSSSCPPIIGAVEVGSATELAVTVIDPPADQPCTADIAPRTAVLQVADTTELSGDTVAVLTGGGFDGVRVPIVGSR
ncbi:hypothetical protein GCG21_04310 [Pseudactinotalea sp. HY160]|uniref:hypothetical protein n=1 Tax=Pseudactinotalea sp. HY160 TaxID=2654490 RepID=UPI00128B00AF|nr:hypothetical protein [Pseudactinotalea sp. HY160]MPV49237.1 hypothetical protein [Pseudactinotalea sp. HY160]